MSVQGRSGLSDFSQQPGAEAQGIMQIRAAYQNHPAAVPVSKGRTFADLPDELIKAILQLVSENPEKGIDLTCRRFYYLHTVSLCKGTFDEVFSDSALITEKKLARIISALVGCQL